MKQGHKIFIAASVLIAAVVFIFWKQIKAAFTKTTTAINNAANLTGNGSTTTGATFPLKKGSSGTEVKNLQKFLNWSNDTYNLSEDGVFGNHTEAAVQQETNGSEISKQYYDSFVVPFLNGDYQMPDQSGFVYNILHPLNLQ